MSRRHRIDRETVRDLEDRFGKPKIAFTKRQRFVTLDTEARESGAAATFRRSARHSVRRQLRESVKTPHIEHDIHDDREVHILSRAAGTL